MIDEDRGGGVSRMEWYGDTNSGWGGREMGERCDYTTMTDQEITPINDALIVVIPNFIIFSMFQILY